MRGGGEDGEVLAMCVHGAMSTVCRALSANPGAGTEENPSYQVVIISWSHDCLGVTKTMRKPLKNAWESTKHSPTSINHRVHLHASASVHLAQLR